MPWLPSFDRIHDQYPMSHRRRLALVAVASGAVSLVVEHLPVWPRKSASAATAAQQNTIATGVGSGNGAGMSSAMPAGGMSGAPNPTVPAAPTTAAATSTATGTGPVVLATVAQIPVGSAVIFTEHKVVVTRPVANTLNAFSAVCTHIGCLLNRVDAKKIMCPCHRGVFNLDGTVASGPPPEPLHPAGNVRLQGDQIVLF